MDLDRREKLKFLPEGKDWRWPFMAIDRFQEAAADGVMEARRTAF